MQAIISLLRGVNVGGHNKLAMSELKKLYESLGLKQPRTYIQSGNVVFLSKERDLRTLASRIESAIEKQFGFRPDVVLRTASEIRDVIAGSPFAGRAQLDASKLLVTFLREEPDAGMRAALAAITGFPEELHLRGRELYVYFPAGIGQSKLAPVLTRVLKNTGTARNWNTVAKLLQMAEELEKI